MMLLGLSKIAAGGLIPSILENSKIRIIAITTKTFNDIDIEINVVEKTVLFSAIPANKLLRIQHLKNLYPMKIVHLSAGFLS